MLRILANDFGQNHGFTHLDWHDENRYTLTSWEVNYGTSGHLALRRDLAALLRPDMIMVGERFLFLHENRGRDKIDYTPCEYIGVTKLHCLMNGIAMEWQNASQACGASAFWGDNDKGGNAKIKKLGLWQPGQKHAMDSLRHALYYFSFELNNDFFIRQLKED